VKCKTIAANSELFMQGYDCGVERRCRRNPSRETDGFMCNAAKIIG
jgi:hypothetical protein